MPEWDVQGCEREKCSGLVDKQSYDLIFLIYMASVEKQLGTENQHERSAKGKEQDMCQRTT
jgi:hypothetical protein